MNDKLKNLNCFLIKNNIDANKSVIVSYDNNLNDIIVKENYGLLADDIFDAKQLVLITNYFNDFTPLQREMFSVAKAISTKIVLVVYDRGCYTMYKKQKKTSHYEMVTLDKKLSERARQLRIKSERAFKFMKF